MIDISLINNNIALFIIVILFIFCALFFIIQSSEKESL